MAEEVTVVIADNHPTWRAGMKSVLEKDPSVRVVGEAANGEALRLVEMYQPQVLLLDMSMPELDGLEVAKQMRQTRSTTAILAISAYDDDAYKQGMLEYGAQGYLTKDQPPSTIREAVIAAAKGEGRWFVNPVTPDTEMHIFTSRELEVLTLFAGGAELEEAANELCLSIHTVKNHLRSIYEKIGVRKIHQAVSWAWKHGIVGKGSTPPGS